MASHTSEIVLPHVRHTSGPLSPFSGSKPRASHTMCEHLLLICTHSPSKCSRFDVLDTENYVSQLFTHLLGHACVPFPIPPPPRGLHFIITVAIFLTFLGGGVSVPSRGKQFLMGAFSGCLTAYSRSTGTSPHHTVLSEWKPKYSPAALYPNPFRIRGWSTGHTLQVPQNLPCCRGSGDRPLARVRPVGSTSSTGEVEEGQGGPADLNTLN